MHFTKLLDICKKGYEELYRSSWLRHFTHFLSKVYTRWKHQKTTGRLMFCGGYRERSVTWIVLKNCEKKTVPMDSFFKTLMILGTDRLKNIITAPSKLYAIICSIILLLFINLKYALYEKWRFSLRISSVNNFIFCAVM